MTAVVAQHCGLFPYGWMGVWLFFVISGFVVTGSALEGAREVAPGRRFGAFMSRRARRIIPVYYAYVLVGAVVVVLSGNRLDPVAFTSLLGFFSNTAMAVGRGEFVGWPVGHLWTISIEMQFYLVFGLVLVYASERVAKIIFVAALFAAPLLRLAASDALTRFGWSIDPAYAIYSGSLLHSDSFAAGALLAFAMRDGKLRPFARPLALMGAMSLLCYVLFYVGVNGMDGATGIDQLRNVISGVLWGQYRQVFVYSVLAAACAGLVAMAACRDPLLEWLLGRPLLQRIGYVSYGAYVFHSLVIFVVLAALEIAAEHHPGRALSRHASAYAGNRLSGDAGGGRDVVPLLREQVPGQDDNVVGRSTAGTLRGASRNFAPRLIERRPQLRGMPAGAMPRFCAAMRNGAFTAP